MPSRKTKRTKPRRSSGGRLLEPIQGLRRPIILGILVLASTVGIYVYQAASAATPSTSFTEIVSNIGSGTKQNQVSGGPYCLDDRSDSTSANNVIDTWPCNQSPAQQWTVSGSKIKLDSSHCIAVQDSATKEGSPVVLNTCSTTAAGQDWTFGTGSEHEIKNNHSGYCLDIKTDAVKTQLDVWNCNGGGNQSWSTKTVSSGGGGGGGGSSVGQQIHDEAALFAGKEQETPNGCNCGGKVIDGANIDTFTQNHPEFWCADFISWVYWKVGHGFGDRGGAYKKTSSITGIKDWFQSNGHWYTDNATNIKNNPPQIGDFVDYGNGDHGGIVDKTPTGSSLTTIDGNWANGVNWETRSDWKSDSDITGWGRLDSAN